MLWEEFCCSRLLQGRGGEWGFPQMRPEKSAITWGTSGCLCFMQCCAVATGLAGDFGAFSGQRAAELFHTHPGG